MRGTVVMGHSRMISRTLSTEMLYRSLAKEKFKYFPVLGKWSAVVVGDVVFMAVAGASVG
jgi:hypothetical protein